MILGIDGSITVTRLEGPVDTVEGFIPVPRQPHKLGELTVGSVLFSSELSRPVELLEPRAFLDALPHPNAIDIVTRLYELHGIIPTDIDEVAESISIREAAINQLKTSFMKHQEFIDAAAGTEGLVQAAKDLADKTSDLDDQIIMIDLRSLQATVRRNQAPSGMQYRQINCAMRLLRVTYADAKEIDFAF